MLEVLGLAYAQLVWNAVRQEGARNVGEADNELRFLAIGEVIGGCHVVDLFGIHFGCLFWVKPTREHLRPGLDTPESEVGVKNLRTEFIPPALRAVLLDAGLDAPIWSVTCICSER